MKSAMATASDWPRPFVYSQKSSEHSKQIQRQKQIRENPETLFADNDHNTMSHLLFFTENSSLWHTAFCQHFTFITKRGICKGRQILIFEDEERNEDSRILSLNIYQNGTVMIQGSDPALRSFIVDLTEMKKQSQIETSSIQKHEDLPTDSSPKDIQHTATTTTALTQSPMSKMKEHFSLLEMDMVELKEFIMSECLNDNSNMEQLKKNIMTLRQEVEDLQRNKEQMSKELQQTKDELREMKSIMGKQLTEIKSEMQEELFIFKLELQKKDEVINNMKEELSQVHTCRESSAKHPTCSVILADNHQSLPADESQSSPEDHSSASDNTTETEALILIDSNGKYVNQKLLFPKMKAQKFWCPNTRKALQILSDKNLNETYKHIIIHTGTNDLRVMEGHVAPALREVAIKASERFPDTRITMSRLLPRTDVPFHVIQGNNAELSRSCALIPNVYLAYHRDIRPHHMYDHVHLNKQGVQLFTRVLKNTALNKREHNRNPHSKSRSQTERNIHPSSESRENSTPGSSSQPESYAAAVQQTPNPAADELNQIRHLLNIICSKLLK